MSCSRGYWCSDAHQSSPGCGRHFRSLEAFDAHRAGGECLPSAVLVGRGWRLVEGFWLSPRDLARLEKAAGQGVHAREEPRARAGRGEGPGAPPPGRRGAAGAA